MPSIDLTKPVICEPDPFGGETYCIECFRTKKHSRLSFYNSHGPFCSKKCFANFVGVLVQDLPNVESRSSFDD